MHFDISQAEYDRLLLAKEHKKYGHLETWKELYAFQRTIGTPEQIRDIAGYARRHNNGEKIRLPLAIQRQIDEKQEKTV